MNLAQTFAIAWQAVKDNRLRSMLTALGIVIGIAAVALALWFTTVLDAILYAYGFMVSGLFIPTLGAYFWRRGTATAAMIAMLAGGIFNLLLASKLLRLPEVIQDIGFDFSVYGILLSAICYVGVSLIWPETPTAAECCPDSLAGNAKEPTS